MAILTNEEYNTLWTAPAPIGFGQIGCPPCYHEYLQREIYAQDFLDLYIGEPTFIRVPIPVQGGVKFYVQITGNPILGGLGIPPHPILVLLHGGNEYLLIDYAYPWTPAELNVERYIRKVLIAEAAPPQNPRITIHGANNIQNSYFYNYQHNNITPYFLDPCTAFAIPAGAKRDRLIGLADGGVVLLDLFPFALNYTSPFRNNLNLTGITNSFFNNVGNIYSVTNRVLEIIANHLMCIDFINGTNSVLIAPPIISFHLAHQINIIPVVMNTNPLIFTIGENLPGHNPLTPDGRLFFDIPAGTTIADMQIPLGINPFTIRVPRYICSAYDGSLQRPNSFFINNALL